MNNEILSVYRLTSERVVVIAKNFRNEIVFKGLSTDFTRIEGFLLKLREEKRNGFIEALTKGNQSICVFFIEERKPVGMNAIPEFGPCLISSIGFP